MDLMLVKLRFKNHKNLSIEQSDYANEFQEFQNEIEHSNFYVFRSMQMISKNIIY